jgi:hypothetical protein
MASRLDALSIVATQSMIVLAALGSVAATWLGSMTVNVFDETRTVRCRAS